MKCTLLNALASLHAIGFPFRKPDPCQSQQGVCEAWGWRSGDTRPPARVLFPVSFFHTVLHYGAGLPLLGQDGASIDGLVKRFAMLSCFFFGVRKCTLLMISCGYISIRRSIHEAHHRQIDTRDEGSSVLIQHCKRCEKKLCVCETSFGKGQESCFKRSRGWAKWYGK